MIIHSITEDLFREYGRIIKGYDTTYLAECLSKTPVPKEGSLYLASAKELEKPELQKFFSEHIYGDMPVQLGCCNGFNTKLNALEYHRDSEINFGTRDFILLLAKRSQLDKRFHLKSEDVVAFKVPANTLIEVYASTLHYCPVQVDDKNGFQMLVALPKGTNGKKPEIEIITEEDELLFASNKWLIACADSPEAEKGAYIGIDGINIDLKDEKR